ncbi:MAG: hypothetical protein M0027_02605 [Candidatus Dormibacteraeota bacterium]|nr:hypothetical protein [Candidatus Dormibacteraeota bacterium]
MSDAPPSLGPDEMARVLYQALAGAGHAAYCSAGLGPLYDEEERRWGRSSSHCTCGRDMALVMYEQWRPRGARK